MRYTTIALIVALAASPALAGEARILRGTARVVDADTFYIGRDKIRPDGIDAPEIKQTCCRPDGSSWPCGLVARKALDKLVKDREVSCEITPEVDHSGAGREIAKNCTADGVNIQAELVRLGMAEAYVHYSDQYLPQEAEARAAKRGIFQGSYLQPWKWRKLKREGWPIDDLNACPPPTALD